VRTIALTACPVCATTAARPFELGDAQLRACSGCGCVYAASYADPSEVFVDGYLTSGSTFGTDITHPRFQAWLAEVNAERLDVLEPIVGLWPDALDVGCGSGEFLVAAARRGWPAVGVEPVAESAAAARARGLDVRAARLEDAGLEPASFDVVCAFHVLEHMPDAVAFLRTLAAHARPGGHVVVESPNWDSTMRRNAGAGWMHLRPLEHLVHFTPGTLDRALTRAGLIPVRTVTRAYLSPRHTLAEATQAIGREGWTERLGARDAPPTRAAWAALKAAAARDDLRLRGAALLAVARVP
jgi:SAM-dependent methyltransferase